ncbi:hypothetical protein SARC_01430 [Sphaeroforma arctica JP610]|uniref:Uncharacterized protein n=1 Tax=Sphaeroforma arctica JP610 TaxID=667725 RepID=A0A0L0GBY9_9EUKA|nr:hypothetical protein SARC_01430 [Sphaeroforma arctica JP610]KNC86424.1 hypothetical protein SARC_01430 [Sphaeroforma arctica JP610]|eukprot:XP_014160326.1 hypothetical protein SARC_01430 [Sphaeroforma arctica JP610]
MCYSALSGNEERVEEMHKEDELDLVEEHILPRIPDVLAPVELPVGDIDPGKMCKDFQSFDEGPLRALSKDIGVPQADIEAMVVAIKSIAYDKDNPTFVNLPDVELRVRTDAVPLPYVQLQGYGCSGGPKG